MPVPFIARLSENRPSDSSSPQTMAQIKGSVVVTRKMPRLGSEGSASEVTQLHRRLLSARRRGASGETPLEGGCYPGARGTPRCLGGFRG